MRYATFIDSFIGTSLVVAGKWANRTCQIYWNINIICAFLLLSFLSLSFSFILYFFTFCCMRILRARSICYCANKLDFPWKSIFSNQIALNLMMLARTKDAHGIFSSWLFTSLHFIPFHFAVSLILSLIWLFSSLLSLCIFAAFNYSGGYFNPVLATALKWGCSGYTNIDHIVVYWIGACAGAILSVPLYKYDVIKKLIGEESLAKLKPKAD